MNFLQLAICGYIVSAATLSAMDNKKVTQPITPSKAIELFKVTPAIMPTSVGSTIHIAPQNISQQTQQQKKTPPVGHKRRIAKGVRHLDELIKLAQTAKWD